MTRTHTHLICPLCGYDECPENGIQAATGNMLLHYIDDHWPFIDRLKDTADDHNARVQLLAETFGLHAEHEHE